MALNIMSDELIDDSSKDIPIARLKGSLSVKDRFKFRLSCLLKADVIVPEVKDSKTFSIYIKPLIGSPSMTMVQNKRVEGFAKDIQSAMRNIAKSNGPRTEQLSQDQWDVILLYISPYTDEIINQLRQVFENYSDKLDALVVQTLGLDDVDEGGSSLDTELGDLVIRLHQLVQGYGDTIKQQNELIDHGWNLVHRCPALTVRLRSLLGSKFSNELYGLICRLSHPLRTHHTMVRAASTFEVFRLVEFHLGSPRPLHKAVNSPPHAPRQQQQQAQSLQLDRVMSPPPRLVSTRKSLVDIIQPYLPEEDRGLGIVRLQPALKQAAALLIGSVLGDMRVPVGSEAYYQFGFVTCHNMEEERALGRYYRQFLETTLDPTIAFKSIVKALEFDTLAGLLRNKGRQDLDKAFPLLGQFLNDPSKERPSVHRLIQSIRDSDNDEPAPCLMRDYGFKYCTQREQVTKLKGLYAMILNRVEPASLHGECRYGRLWECARETLGYVDPSIRRLLQNDYSHPAIGFDNSQGLEAYMKPLFKRTLRG